MANMTPSRFGADNGAADKRGLFLKVSTGEVLTAFAENNVFMERHSVRTIEHGKSAQHVVSGKGIASYHVPGTQLLGTDVGFSERVITIDDMLVGDRAIADIDEAVAHYDVRSVYTRDIGMALARSLDQHVAQVGVLAARASATVTGGNGGTAITSATSGTNGDALVAAFFDAAEALDEKDIPENDRFGFLKPAQYYLAIEAAKIVNRDYTEGVNGGVDSGKIIRIAGIPVVKTNNVPSTNVATGPDAYRGDFSTTVALIMQREAVGTTKLLDLRMEMDYLIDYQTWLVVGKYAVGHGILRPECAVEIKSA